MSKYRKVKEWYETHEKNVSTFSLVGGFLFDSFALNRIDSPFVNGWLLFNLLAVVACIVLINREDNIGPKHDSWKHFWLFNIMQFGFGAILGGSFRFYLRSGTIAGSWPFLLILLGALLANEYLRKHHARLIFRLGFLYLSIFVLSIFMLPLLFHRIGALVFILSGIVSLLLFRVFKAMLRKFGKEKSARNAKTIWLSTFSIFAIINILYFTNLIPPIPLSLNDAGVYHSIAVDSQGNYRVASEKKIGLSKYLEFREKIHLVEGEPLYAYAAIFAPGSLTTEVVQEWQSKNTYGEWVTATRIPLYLSGGREEGFRTYSTKFSLTPGDWRVNVKTLRGQLIGRINFEIIKTDTSPELTTSVKS